MAKQWFLVHTKTRQEFLAEANLRRQGYDTFLPIRRETIRRAGHFQTHRLAHFPGYLFVSFNEHHQRWRPINNTIGVRRLIACADRPCPAPDGFVETLMAMASAEGELGLETEFAVGQRVRVMQGPMAGYTGVIDGLFGDERVRVLLELVDGAASMLTSKQMLEAS